MFTYPLTAMTQEDREQQNYFGEEIHRLSLPNGWVAVVEKRQYISSTWYWLQLIDSQGNTHDRDLNTQFAGAAIEAAVTVRWVAELFG